jgi:FxLD family lantipeptide
MFTELSAVASESQDRDDFALDVTIVEAGPGRLALMADTDDNCDTKKDGDC